MRGTITYGRDGAKRYTIEDKEVSQEEFDEAFPSKPIGLPGQSQTGTCWPMRSEALAVHPAQIGEAVESARKRGVPTEFDRLGRPVLTDRGHRRQYLRAYGFHDNQGGYGD